MDKKNKTFAMLIKLTLNLNSIFYCSVKAANKIFVEARTISWSFELPEFPVTSNKCFALFWTECSTSSRGTKILSLTQDTIVLKFTNRIQVLFFGLNSYQTTIVPRVYKYRYKLDLNSNLSEN